MRFHVSKMKKASDVWFFEFLRAFRVLRGKTAYASRLRPGGSMPKSTTWRTMPCIEVVVAGVARVERVWSPPGLGRG